MALSFPSEEEWESHDDFLLQVKSTVEVKRKAAGLPTLASMLDAMRSTNLLGETLLSRGGPHPGPNTLAEMFRPDAPPFECLEVLPVERRERIAMLRQWLARLPAQVWLERSEPVKAAFSSFQRVCKRSDCPPELRDDLAEFRFWHFAHWVARASKAHRYSPAMLPPPDADQRKRAAMAAKEIERISGASTLLMSAGVPFEHREHVLSALQAIQAHAMVPRRKRMDAFEKEREFIRTMTHIADRRIGVAPTATVASMVRLFVRHTEEDDLRKHIVATKKEIKADRRGEKTT